MATQKKTTKVKNRRTRLVRRKIVPPFQIQFIHLYLKKRKVIGTCFAESGFAFLMDEGFRGTSCALILPSYYGPSSTPSSNKRSETSLSVSQKPSLAHPELWITTVIKLLKKPSSQMSCSLMPGCESLNSRRIFSKASSENATF